VAAKDQFAHNLVKERQRRGLSQDDLAELAGMHRTAISLLERRGRDPRLETIVKLARALGIKPTALMRGID
jgi:transcriptional regulator with XRE-family HTH domain